MLNAIHVFVVAATSESFSHAARKLGVLPSSVTRKISAIEEKLGVALFVRSTRRVELTEAGKIYLEAAQRALKEVQLGEIAATSLGNEVRGTLVVETQFMLGAKIVAKALPELHRRNPNLRVELRTHHIQPNGISEGVDVSVRYELGTDSELVAQKFAVSRRVVVASPEYLQRRGIPKHPLDLLQHDCVEYAPGGKSLSWSFRGPDFEGTIHPVGPIKTNDGFSMLAAATAGLGIATAHDWMVASELMSGKLLRIMTDYEVRTLSSFETPLYIIYSRHLRQSPKVRAFVSCMVDIYGKSPIGMMTLCSTSATVQ